MTGRDVIFNLQAENNFHLQAQGDFSEAICTKFPRYNLLFYSAYGIFFIKIWGCSLGI